MVSLFSASNVNRILLCGVLTTFTMAVVTPPPAYAQQIGLNDIAFWARIEKLVEKMWKYKDKKDGNKAEHPYFLFLFSNFDWKSNGKRSLSSTSSSLREISDTT